MAAKLGTGMTGPRWAALLPGDDGDTPSSGASSSSASEGERREERQPRPGPPRGRVGARGGVSYEELEAHGHRAPEPPSPRSRSRSPAGAGKDRSAAIAAAEPSERPAPALVQNEFGNWELAKPAGEEPQEESARVVRWRQQAALQELRKRTLRERVAGHEARLDTLDLSRMRGAAEREEGRRRG